MIQDQLPESKLAYKLKRRSGRCICHACDNTILTESIFFAA